MIAHIHFQRDSQCEHDPNRECTVCFKAAMLPYFESLQSFEEAWQSRSFGTETNEDIADTFSVYL